jgi:hypothetical protein
MKLAPKLTPLVADGLLFMCRARSFDAHRSAAQPCTSGASSIMLGEPPVTTWYPPGCVHP